MDAEEYLINEDMARLQVQLGVSTEDGGRRERKEGTEGEERGEEVVRRRGGRKIVHVTNDSTTVNTYRLLNRLLYRLKTYFFLLFSSSESDASVTLVTMSHPPVSLSAALLLPSAPAGFNADESRERRQEDVVEIGAVGGAVWAVGAVGAVWEVEKV